MIGYLCSGRWISCSWFSLTQCFCLSCFTAGLSCVSWMRRQRAFRRDAFFGHDSLSLPTSSYLVHLQAGPGRCATFWRARDAPSRGVPFHYNKLLHQPICMFTVPDMVMLVAVAGHQKVVILVERALRLRFVACQIFVWCLCAWRGTILKRLISKCTELGLTRQHSLCL